MPPSPRRHLGCIAVLALTLTACGRDLPAQPTQGSSSTSSTSTTTTEALDRPEQQQIDAATARTALPTRADMPDSTWLVDTSTFSDDPRTYDPAECASVRFDSPQLRTFTDQHQQVTEQARFSQNQDDGGLILGAWISSYDAPFPLSFFDDAGQALAACGEYTETKDGDTSEHAPAAITVPQLGDRSFGVRVTSPQSGSSVDRIYIRSGHNLITVMVLSREDSYDGTLVQTYAQRILDDLKKATS